MRNKGGREDGKCSGFSSLCGDRCSCVSAPLQQIEQVSFNRIGAVLPTLWFSLYCTNILVLLTCQRQYIGAASILKKIRKILKFARCQCFFAYWCCKHCSTNLLVQPCQLHQYIGGSYIVAPIYWCKLMVKIQIIVSTVETGMICTRQWLNYD